MIKPLAALVIFLTIYEVEMVRSGGVVGYNEKIEYVIKCKEELFKFKAEDKKYFNCTATEVEAEGYSYCSNAPCGNSFYCNWQVYPGTEVILKPGNFYYLYQCSLCPTMDCNNKYAFANNRECGYEGVFKTNSAGWFWYCENKRCRGQMKERIDKKGYYDCYDTKCWGTGKLDEYYKCKDN